MCSNPKSQNRLNRRRSLTLSSSGLSLASRISLRVVLAGLLTITACNKAPEQDPELQRLNNRGVALMGRFDYPAAADVFRELYVQAPEWPMARVNLAVATLNRQNPGDEATALELLEPLLTVTGPEQARANFMAGILHFNQGRTEAALERFRAASELVPGDAYANYFLGQVLLQTGAAEQALERFETAGRQDSYLRSAFYGQFLARQRLGQRQEARQALAVYERLEDNPQSRLAEIKYTRMGPLAMARPVSPPGQGPASDRGEGTSPGRAPKGPAFGEPVLIAADVPAVHGSTLAKPKDGSLSVALTLVGERAVWSCSLSECAPLATPSQAPQASAWGDMNGDGSADRLLLATDGLWIQSQDGQDWVEVLPDDPLVGADGWQDLAVLDADHDGDLDVLLIGTERPGLLISNNGNGSFRRLDDYLPPLIPARQVLATDLDRDRDLDLVLVGETGQQVLLNDRLWRYSAPPDPLPPWAQEAVLALTLADLDVDGQLEAIAIRGDKVTVWRDTDAGWTAEQAFAHGFDRPERFLLHDFVGAGTPQLLVGDAQRWQLISLDDGVKLAEGNGLVLGPTVSDTEQGPGLLISNESQVTLLPPGSGRFAFATLALSGLTDPGQSMRSNASGLGTRVVAQTASRWQVLGNASTTAMPGQNLLPVTVGLGGADALAAVTLDWSDGVYQTEIDLGPGLHSITETQRQLASCPVLFQWDGEAYRFVTDVLGVGGMGFNLGFGEYAAPRPWEKLLIDAPETGSGPLRLMIAEPMEESAYLDHVSVTALDFPTEWEPRLDERMATDEVQATGELLWAKRYVEPAAAVDHRGVDIREEILATDRKAAPLPALDPQLTGLLKTSQVITLDFEQDLAALNAPALVFDGWVEYGYSQTLFAAWQADRVYDAVSLELEQDGQWVAWRPSFGYPAGMPRAATLPLTGLPAGVSRLRLRTQQQIYFDRLAVIETDLPTGVQHRRLTLTEARVSHVGFARRTNGPQMQPAYEFARRDTFWDTRYQRGHYTALGPATELVAERDNALAIIGPGDALELVFDYSLPPPASGMSRKLLVTFHGWAKDMDLFTQYGETVGPLPSASDVEQDRSAVLHARYNTRFRSGR
ncbi:MAG: FG-GAP-like repeat-containing protein [Pseudomonadota bacterium]